MIFDLNQAAPADTKPYDLCIAGGGVAGITLAITLAARGKRVALLEGGGFEYTEESQEVYQGPVTGRAYFALDEARLRFLGGTSNHWGGRCRPLDARDFEKRSYIPYSGWPIEKIELDQYIAAASQIVEIESGFLDHGVEGSDNSLNQIKFQFGPPVRFRDKYEEELRKSKRIDVFLNANLVNISLDRGTGRITEFQCANYVDTKQLHYFHATAFALAMGGIENPRLLLNCRDDVPTGIGNGKDLVGRFFMDHFHVLAGYYVANQKSWPFEDKEVVLSPTNSFMDDQRIANAGLRVVPDTEQSTLLDSAKKNTKRLLCANDLIRDFAQSIQTFVCPPPFDRAGFLMVASEPVPNPNSRVRLVDDTDRFGLQRSALDWQISDIDWRTINVTTTAFGRYLASRGYGGVKLADWLLNEDRSVPDVAQDQWLGAGWHHMGTTRMANKRDEGVVDRNCKVFDTANLYIAGSSVFSTAGHTNPTLTIVQLALRLCDHLDQTLAR